MIFKQNLVNNKKDQLERSIHFANKVVSKSNTLILIDASKSMKPMINQIKIKINSVLKELKKDDSLKN